MDTDKWADMINAPPDSSDTDTEEDRDREPPGVFPRGYFADDAQDFDTNYCYYCSSDEEPRNTMTDSKASVVMGDDLPLLRLEPKPEQLDSLEDEEGKPRETCGESGWHTLA